MNDKIVFGMNKFCLLIAVCLMGGIGSIAAQEVQEAETPVVIPAPDTVINKTAYTLTSQGITIAVSYGSAYPAGHAYNNIDSTYFACLAGGQMTISADKNIKGIVVNGWLKKNFTASSDWGTLYYHSDEYDDYVGESALIATDIDYPSITISCDNQLRCFSLEVYFSSNPDIPQYEEESVDTVSFVAVAAEALDYSDDPDYSSVGAYSYWLKLVPQETYPQVWLDLYSARKGDLSGEYCYENFNTGNYTYVQYGPEYWDYEYACDQVFTITRHDDAYHIEGYIIAYNYCMYQFVYDGPVTFTLDEEEQGIDDIYTAAPGEDRGRLILQNGQVRILRNNRIYTIIGQSLQP